MTGPRRVVIVGGSLAGVSAADALRQHGYDGTITLVGDESHPAYSRPPLSKGVLKGTEPAESVLLPATGADVEVRRGAAAVHLDVQACRVGLADGEELPFDGLVIATGSRARRLRENRDEPGGGEIVLRSLDDALALRPRLARARSVLVVGGGFLGMEIASVSRQLGLEVTVVDLRPPLAAVLGPWPAAVFAEAARDHSVRLEVSPGGVRLLERGRGVELADGTRLEADLVVTAAGDLPNVEWLARSGLELRGGVVVDSRCRVTDHIVAAGDVTAFPVPGGAPRRTPHWDSAIAQARVAAAALLLADAAPCHRPDPYYWTEAFGLAVKIAGPLPVTGPPTVVEGDLDARSALLLWTRSTGNTVVAMNRRLSVGRLRRLAAAA